MCGIVAYIGQRRASELILEGLHRLEYRGYDSAGVAVHDGQEVQVRKCSGRVHGLSLLLDESPVTGSLGIGHTRWATHGETIDLNAHPHRGGDGEVLVVHNGVIENHARLRQEMVEQGYEFQSQTDTEVIAHLIADQYRKLIEDGLGAGMPETCLNAIDLTLPRLKGTYGLAILFKDCSTHLFATRVGSPLVIGIGQNEYFVASDASPLIGHADEVTYLSDQETAVLSSERMEIIHRDTGPRVPTVQVLDEMADEIDLGEFEHYMLKEIFEQPQTVENAFRGRIDEDSATAVFGGLNLNPQQLRGINRIILTACGTSWHAGLVGEYLLEEIAGIPTEVEYASELRYRNSPMSEGTMVFAITQSGETADTLAAMRECKRKGHPTLAICNTVGSTIARESDGGIYLHAGPEIGVASTKAFTSQVTVLMLLSLFLGRMRHLSFPAGQHIINSLKSIPEVIGRALETNRVVREVAAKYASHSSFLFLGRLHNFPVALEGALKLKEISYIHAEGYPAAEMKHGPIALIDEQTPSVFIVPRGGIYPKVMSNLEEVRARRGPIIAIASESDEEIGAFTDDVIRIPDVDDCMQPLVGVIPLQLLAYHVAVLRGCNVDRPRNLAKSVTVE